MQAARTCASMNEHALSHGEARRFPGSTSEEHRPVFHTFCTQFSTGGTPCQ